MREGEGLIGMGTRGTDRDGGQGVGFLLINHQ
jgi:hypothetical protein